MPKKYMKAMPGELVAGKPHSHAKYRKPVAMVYGEINGVFFNQTFKHLKRAETVARETNGTLVLL